MPETTDRFVAVEPRSPRPVLEEGTHVARVCNACRYCEGLCPVFPAIERRLSFSESDLRYFANLCHDCGECLDACQYAPPHPFGVDVPRTLAAIRRASYQHYAWPHAFSGLFERSTLTLVLSAVLAPVLFAATLAVTAGAETFLAPHRDADGAFYQVMSHTAMVGLFGGLAVLSVMALLVGVFRGWQDLIDTAVPAPSPVTVRQALRDVLTLRYLGPHRDVDRGFRRVWHHCTFYGFLLCFAATSVAAVYHNLMGWMAPYPLLSVPVMLGVLGGVGLILGPIGLLWIKVRRPAERHDRAQFGMDVVFLVLLFETSVTGFLLLALRESAAMGPMLGIHLGAVAGLFVMLPFGKFVHGVYRCCAVLRSVIEGGLK
ncbi:MAG: tricarballylate utilization 4Fe-4S protein TcuB [Acidobacteriota bacterium]|nr:tricarballylate utilization 4Fe-4S protein TcuB [Acidobacteriota bacterium]